MDSEPPHLDKQKTVLPGFGLPLNDTPPNSKAFPNALNPTSYRRSRLITLREFTMLQIMDEITSKPGWQKKMLDETISSKWKEEILNSDENVSDLMLEYIFDELHYKAHVFATTGIITVFDSGVVKSDTIVPEEFKTALQDAVRPLENVPEGKKDWHPGSDGKVLDLVHPSLFPLVYGRSQILPEGRMGIEEGLRLSGKGVTLPVPPEEETRIPYGLFLMEREVFSNKFQWLPCEVDIREKAKITSYINNLHPKEHSALYGLIEQLIDYAIPLWDMALTPLRDPGAEIVRVEYKVPKYVPEYEDCSGSDSDDSEEEYDEEYWDRAAQRYQLWENTRTVVQPEPSKRFAPPTVQSPVRIREEYRERGLQVIVKLANIELTPEKPAYNGGAWHVEGQMNEHIVASALYYYSSENISTSTLAFRQLCNSEINEIEYVQNDHGWLPEVFGLENNEPAVQILGGVNTPEGRLLSFNNSLQHSVLPFILKDLAKPGHRKIVALFLVDPNVKMISTANVPCQRKDWWREELEATAALGKLPLELRDQVVEDMEFPIEMEEAKRLREELMEERKDFTIQQDGMFMSVDISLCEH